MKIAGEYVGFANFLRFLLFYDAYLIPPFNTLHNGQKISLINSGSAFYLQNETKSFTGKFHPPKLRKVAEFCWGEFHSKFKPIYAKIRDSVILKVARIARSTGTNYLCIFESQK